MGVLNSTDIVPYFRQTRSRTRASFSSNFTPIKIDNVEYHTHHQHHRDTKYPLHKRRHPVQTEVELVLRLLVHVIPLI